MRYYCIGCPRVARYALHVLRVWLNIIFRIAIIGSSRNNGTRVQSVVIRTIVIVVYCIWRVSLFRGERDNGSCSNRVPFPERAKWQRSDLGSNLGSSTATVQVWLVKMPRERYLGCSASRRKVQTNLHLELSTCHSRSGTSDGLVSGKLGSAAVRASD